MQWWLLFYHEVWIFVYSLEFKIKFIWNLVFECFFSKYDFLQFNIDFMVWSRILYKYVWWLYCTEFSSRTFQNVSSSCWFGGVLISNWTSAFLFTISVLLILVTLEMSCLTHFKTVFVFFLHIGTKSFLFILFLFSFLHLNT